MPDLSSPRARSRNSWYYFNRSETVFIFIHGIFSDCKSCWTHQSAVDPSNVVFWPDLIINDSRLDTPSIFLGGYETSLSSGDLRIKDAARDVLDAMRMEDFQGRPAPFEKRNIVFIGHSTGGIVARYLLERFKEQFADKTVGLVLLASPSLGSIYANKLRALAKFYSQELGLQLQWGGEDLADLDDRFKDLVYENKIPRLLGVEAYEHYFILRNSLFPGFIEPFIPNRRKVVSALSAARYFGAPRLLSGTDHFSAAKPDSVDHSSHKLLVNFWSDFKGRFEPNLNVALSSHSKTGETLTCVPLLFRDQLRTNPASVANAVYQCSQGQKSFEIYWPQENSDLLRIADDFLADAEKFYDRASRFYGEVPEKVMSFTRLARPAIGRAKAIRAKAVHRLVPMLAGMRAYYGESAEVESLRTAVGNYLELSNFEAQFDIAYALSHERTRKSYPYLFWEPWFKLPNQLARMSRLFGHDEEFGRTKAIELCGEIVYELFWGPLAKLLKSIEATIDDTGTRALDNQWFVTCVIPQWNLLEALKDSGTIVEYRPEGKLANLWNSTGSEIEHEIDLP